MQSITEVSIHNAQMLDRLQVVLKAAQELSRRGFVLAGVEIGPRNPVVWVEYTTRCDSLRGAAIVRAAHASILAAPLCGVQVQWEVRKLAS